MTPTAPAEALAHYEHCMALWVAWMGREHGPRGWATRDSICGRSLSNYMASEDDADADLIYENNDRKLAETVNACVESLIPEERLAVYIAHGLARQWPWPRRDQAACLALGVVTLQRLIAKRC